jgi:hypothetical protein
MLQYKILEECTLRCGSHRIVADWIYILSCCDNNWGMEWAVLNGQAAKFERKVAQRLASEPEFKFVLPY